LMAHTYSHLYNLPTTGLRFFTVYGPFGRPDMAYFSFTRMILEGKTIKVFNHGNMRRDFTYIDDITEGIFRLLNHPPKNAGTEDRSQWGPNRSKAPYAIYNIGNHQPVRLMDFIGVIEKTLGIEADKEMLPMQPGDVEETYAEIEGLQQLVGFNPSTPLEVGLPKFIEWYLDFYQPEGAPKAIQQKQ
ncbi:MAG: NAD-dependent epimerase/dehydratase family protein, partial [Phaeodactylibacter sp.]|nr:NAD-dependent epimerase/dehydratase family protein [Phaeodactylibacter sp.]